ncbi:MAG: hypothetical protein ABGX07_11335, partial [Pirellulaceae bacterium]
MLAGGRNRTCRSIEHLVNAPDPNRAEHCRSGFVGTLAEINGMLIINQNDRTHIRVDSLLNM